MIAEIMSHTLVVSGVLTLMGFAAEAYLRGQGRPLRLAWAAALGWSTVLLVALLFTAGRPPRQAEPLMEGEYSALGGVVTVFVNPEMETPGLQLMMLPIRILTLPVRAWDSSVDALGAASRTGAEVLGSSPLGDLGLGVLWGTLTLGALLLLTLSAGRLRRRTRSLPVEGIGGRAVAIDGSLGPAVVGILRPKIVLPRWLLAAPAETLAIVVAHEEEHLRARDTLLLAAALAAVVLAPWNPFFWIQLRRLRLAIELDCDRRVVARGIAPTRYAALLLDLGNRPASLPAGATALAEPPALLERRMKSLCTPLCRMSPLRASLVGTSALLLLIAACSAPVREVPGEVIPAPSRQGIAPIVVEAEAQPAAAASQQALSAGNRSCIGIPGGDQVCGESLSIVSAGDREVPVTSREPEEVVVRGYGVGARPSGASPEWEVVMGYGTNARPQPATLEEVVVVGYGANARPRAASLEEVVVVGYGGNMRPLRGDTLDEVVVEGYPVQAPAPRPAPSAQPTPVSSTSPAPVPSPPAAPRQISSSTDDPYIIVQGYGADAREVSLPPRADGRPFVLSADQQPAIRNLPDVQAALVREYPAELRNSGVGGEVVLHVNVDQNGKIQDCRVIRTSGTRDLDNAALRVCPIYSFVPVQIGGVPTAVWLELPISFQSRISR